MSIRVMTQVWGSGRFDGNQLLLLLALADFADDGGGNVFPSVQKMAEKTRAARRTVQRNLRELVKDGVLVKVRQATRNFPAEYRINLARLQAPPPDEGRQNDAPEGREGRHPDHSGASSATNEGRHGDAQYVNSETSKGPTSARACAREAARTLEEEFEDWYEHYPKRVSRGPAEEAFEKARAGGASLEELIAGAKRYAAQAACRGSPRFVKYPATWLNQKCWLDEYPPPGAGPDGELTWWQKENREAELARKVAENNGGDS